MRKIKLLLPLLLVSSFSFGQNLLMVKKENIVDKYREMSDGVEFSAQWGQTTDDHVTYIRFDDKGSEISKVYYFDKDGYCDLYGVFYPYSQLNDAIYFLNQKFTKTGQDVWMDYGKYIDYRWNLRRYENFFTTTCIVVEMHDIIKQ